MSESTTATRPAGRPRSEAAGVRILDAAVEMLGEKGWEGLSMEALAGRAGVGKATIYRRWASKEEIVIAALERFVEKSRILDTGALRSDLEALVADAAGAHGSTKGRLLPALASAMDRHPNLARAVRLGFLEPRRRAVFAVLERARERGELAADADFDLIFDLLAGPLLYRRLISAAPLGPDLVRDLVETVMRAFGRTRSTRIKERQ